MSVPPLMVPRQPSSRTALYSIEHRPDSPQSPIMSFPVGPLEPLARTLEELGEGGELVVVEQSNQRVIVRWPLTARSS
ncbi:MAG TPA: hypothetical protein VGR16_11775 [Thermomicrobiales bacterium]|nr:hypothetical protein [Thermomicrobiales bacterium]